METIFLKPLREEQILGQNTCPFKYTIFILRVTSNNQDLILVGHRHMVKLSQRINTYFNMYGYYW